MFALASMNHWFDDPISQAYLFQSTVTVDRSRLCIHFVGVFRLVAA
ncbi:hypothetical protein SP19_53 [Salmonella phage 19]|nr:hypothetical protein SP19_53 [Salmonella phage 19]